MLNSAETTKLLDLLNTNDKAENEWEGFNPFDRNNGLIKKRFESTNLNLRKFKMNQLTDDLLANIDDDKKVKELLGEAREFLLDPLENENALMDQDSIYDPNMSREERYLCYEKTMEERITACHRKKTRKLLEIMR
eukprot:CAMPEP_0178928520 /NCGR_PEP_ID=MMETSP0786-20121207/19955_1 /TAXON_ID=186022 /ORGANISM="Thalassionema frauenfeldii, Strain CCMP 1798" /LENGTH=135 /DNA_ID=CAMNT_0020604405 /DNA_START=130 /DNA_END=534 /DNA_ORIENTATION=-